VTSSAATLRYKVKLVEIRYIETENDKLKIDVAILLSERALMGQAISLSFALREAYSSFDPFSFRLSYRDCHNLVSEDQLSFRCQLHHHFSFNCLIKLFPIRGKKLSGIDV